MDDKNDETPPRQTDKYHPWRGCRSWDDFLAILEEYACERARQEQVRSKSEDSSLPCLLSACLTLFAPSICGACMWHAGVPLSRDSRVKDEEFLGKLKFVSCEDAPAARAWQAELCFPKDINDEAQCIFKLRNGRGKVLGCATIYFAHLRISCPLGQGTLSVKDFKDAIRSSVNPLIAVKVAGFPRVEGELLFFDK